MKELQNIHHDFSLAAALTTSSTHTVSIDTKGYAYAQVALIVGTSGATTIPGVCKIEEGDTTSSYAAITGLAIGQLHSATTKSTNAHVLFDAGICLEGRKRYLKVSYTPGTAEVAVVHALLGRGHTLPDSTTEKNVAHNVVV